MRRPVRGHPLDAYCREHVDAAAGAHRVRPHDPSTTIAIGHHHRRRGRARHLSSSPARSGPRRRARTPGRFRGHGPGIDPTSPRHPSEHRARDATRAVLSDACPMPWWPRRCRSPVTTATKSRRTSPGRWTAPISRAVVVIHHMPGYDRSSKEIVRTFGVYGYAALMPNLHHRYAPGSKASDAAAAAGAEAGGVPDEQCRGDVAGAWRCCRPGQRQTARSASSATARGDARRS